MTGAHRKNRIPHRSREFSKLDCINCGSKKLRRRKRGILERMYYAEVHQCSDCGQWIRLPGKLSGFFSMTASCPSCGTVQIKVLRKRDYIDRMYHNPFSWCQRFLGAPLMHCESCRLQFYDIRRLFVDHTKTVGGQASRGAGSQ